MKVFGISVVQNEADIIRENLEWASRFCERIFIWDLGSTDETWDILQQMRSPRIIPEIKTGISWVNSIRGTIYRSVRDQIGVNDWMYLLDADEFVSRDPRDTLAEAEREGAAVVGGWQANFIPTETDAARMKDVGEDAWSRIPIHERLRHYRVEWFEFRFVRNLPGLNWDTSRLWSVIQDANGRPLPVSRREVLLRHYRHRTPEQVALRHQARMESRRRDQSQFGYNLSPNFQSYIRPAEKLRLWPPEETEFHVPAAELMRARLTWLCARARNAIRRRLPDAWKDSSP